MLIEEMKSNGRYHKGTLLACMDEAGVNISYKTLLRRESAGVKEYLAVERDPATNWRMYSPAQIKKIIVYEEKRQGKR